MKHMGKMFTFLILRLVAHIQTTNHVMGPVGGRIGWVYTVRCGMTAGYIGNVSFATGRNGRHFYYSHRKQSSMSQ
jgi:hypothetical protein